MKDLKLIYLFVFLCSGLLFVGCGNDDDHDDDHGDNEVTITIEEPTDGAVIATADCGDVHLHIDFVATDENHEIEILLHREGDVSDVAFTYDEHDHDKVINFDQEVDLCSYPAGTCFHLEVSACVDHDCEEKATAEAEFCLE